MVLEAWVLKVVVPKLAGVPFWLPFKSQPKGSEIHFGKHSCGNSHNIPGPKMTMASFSHLVVKVIVLFTPCKAPFDQTPHGHRLIHRSQTAMFARAPQFGEASRGLPRAKTWCSVGNENGRNSPGAFHACLRSPGSP